MPQRKAVITLQFLCFQTAVRDPERLENLKFLPECLLNEIYEQRKELNLTFRPLPEFFINKMTRKLTDLEEFSPNNCLDLFVIGKVASISKRLADLNLKGSVEIQPHQLIDLIRNIPQILTLELSKTRCNDQVLAAIGKYSNRIQNLSLSSCKDITDDGIIMLGIDTETKLSRNKKITDLNLSDTPITDKGFIIAIKMLRELRQVFSESDIADVDVVFQDELSSNITYNLLTVPFVVVTETDLKVACTLFPKANYLYFDSDMDAWSNPEVVEEFQNSKETINQLHVCNRVNFETVELMAWNFKSDLNLIILEECNLTDLYAVCRCFPRLKHLINYNLISGFDFGEFITVPQGFESLVSFGLDFGDLDVPKNFLEVLLVNCKSLEQFAIRKCQVLSDVVVERVVKSNPFKFLLIFCLRDCNVITVESLRMFLNLDNPLTDIDVLDCDNIGENEISFLRNHVSQLNLGVTNCDICCRD